MQTNDFCTALYTFTVDNLIHVTYEHNLWNEAQKKMHYLFKRNIEFNITNLTRQVTIKLIWCK